MKFETRRLNQCLSLVIDRRGVTPKKLGSDWTDAGYRVLSANNVKSSGLQKTDEIRYVNKTTYQKWMRTEIQRDDILLTSEAPAGEVYVWNSDEKIVVGQRLYALRVKEDVNPWFLAFYLQSPKGKAEIKNKCSGSTVFGISAKTFDSIEIVLPDKTTQDHIADVLHNINSKIEIDNVLSSKLEDFTRMVYDYWFLQFEFPNEEGKPYKSSGGKMVWNEELKREIPEGWSSGTLSDYGDIVGGGTPPTSNQTYYTESYEEIAWLTPYDLANTSDKYIEHGARDITKEGLQKSSAVLMPAGTVLMTSRAPIGYLAISQNEICTNQGFKSIVPNKNYGKEFIYYSLQALMPSIKAQGVGSTFSEISGTTLKRIICLRPDINISNKFEKIIEKTANKRFICEAENRQLTSLRDFLLPLLMNGQVTFKDEAGSEEE